MSLRLFHGPMYSGKTTSLMMEATRVEISHRVSSPDTPLPILIINAKADTRYSDESVIASHSGGIVPCVSVDFLTKVPKAALHGKTDVFIDEVILFKDTPRDVSATIQEWREEGINVYVAALNNSFIGDPFEVVSLLLARADSIVQTKSVCMTCGAHDAVHNALRKSIDPREATGSEEGSVISVGGTEKYMAQCFKCFYET